MRTVCLLKGREYHPAKVLHNDNIPVNVLDPVCIQTGSAEKHGPEAGRMVLARWPASGPDQIHLAQTWPNQPELDQIRAGFV